MVASGEGAAVPGPPGAAAPPAPGLPGGSRSTTALPASDSAGGSRSSTAPSPGVPLPRVASPVSLPPATDPVSVTPAAAELLRSLREQHGPLMFHQSGGCCDGSAPMCYPAGEFRTGGSDVLLASLEIDGVPEPVEFWMSKSQWELWKHTRLTVDVVPGRGSGFSLEAPEGLRFLIRSHLAG